MPPSSPLHGPLPSLDMLLIGVPLVVLLTIGFFRLDTIFASSKNTRSFRRSVQPIALNDDSAMYTDPDGRPWDQH
jgi:hypothetical protein